MKLDTSNRIESFISSLRMEDLETTERILSLGKKLAENIRENDDITAAWMCQYIAEKIELAETAKGKNRAVAQQECFKAILTFWEYQSCVPVDRKPFGNFEPIFRALEQIDPDKASSSYFNQTSEQEAPEGIKTCVEFITGLDSATRTLISFFVREGMLSAVDEESIEWLQAIEGIADSHSRKIIISTLPEIDHSEESKERSRIDSRIEQYQNSINRLEAFESLSSGVRATLTEKLKQLEATRADS